MNQETVLAKSDIEKTVHQEYGDSAELLSWEFIEFTKKGDNYVSSVTGIEASIKLNNEPKKVYYIVKYNPRRDGASWREISIFGFKHETMFLSKLGPDLSKQYLKNDPLRVPKCFHYSLTDNRQFIITNDLRRDGFRLTEKKTCLDKEHSKLVFIEIAKIHASSRLLLQSKSLESIESDYPGITEGIYTNDKIPNFISMMNTIIQNQLDLAIILLEKMPQYKRVSDWVKSKRNNIISTFREQLTYIPDSVFTVISHGDCWNNNLLFRYENGKPVEAMLLDLQICHVSTVGTDLTYYLYTSTHGDMRKSSLQELIDVYYKTYCDVIVSNGGDVPFTVDQLKSQIMEKSPLGFIMGLFIVPFSVVDDASEEPDVTEMKVEEINENLKKELPEMAKLLLSKDIFISRYTGLLDDILLYLDHMDNVTQ